jgi:hypothetical protein
MNMKTDNRTSLGSRDGIALVIVLGLLSVMTILGVAFAIAMRVERLAARNYTNVIKAEHLVQVALVRSLENIDCTCFKYCYPTFTNAPANMLYAPALRDAVASTNSASPDVVKGLLVGDASNAVPGSLLAAAVTASSYCKWQPIPLGGSSTGEIAYIIVNCSGLLDANYVGGKGRTNSTHVEEIDLSALPDMPDWGQFYTNRTRDRRYETVTELAKLNAANGALTDPVSNLFVYSWDPGRDKYYTDYTQLGTRSVNLVDKFNVNSFFDLAASHDNSANAYFPGDAEFQLWRSKLQSVVSSIPNINPDDVTLNIINYLDENRIPQNVAEPWVHTEGTEDVPLINEIAYQKHPGGGQTDFEVVVEVWYPFYPNVCQPFPVDGFGLQIGVFDHLESAEPTGTSPFTALPETPLGKARADWSVGIPSAPISTPYPLNMAFYPSNNADGVYLSQFVCVTSPIITVTNDIYVMATVTKKEGAQYYLIDQGPGYRNNSTTYGLLTLKAPTSSTFDLAVPDPRNNGHSQYWIQQGSSTLGYINANCNTWVRRGQGLPIFHRNGPMQTIGELGYISLANLNALTPDPQDFFWQTINLLSYNHGAYLVDRLTTRATNQPIHGLVSISSAQTNALLALWNNMKIGPEYLPDASGKPLFQTLSPTNNPTAWMAVQGLAATIVSNGPYWGFQDVLTAAWDGGTNGAAFRSVAAAACADHAHTNDIMREDPLRYIIDMITFRQNIFEIILAARIRGKDGSVMAEKHALAVVYRDSYTGKNFMRSFKWLSD